ncbi:MAG: DUF2076 domain-containing protein [Xanthobacteraceae bacterium]|nr:MAG: DUF2076 domain-containing protein [Xanthobacteraceae bacterium]
MTPQERQLIDELFDRLAGLDRAPRDAEAERAIARGLERAPNAPYALVQTVLVQDEALRRANARIEELEASAAAPSGGFLDSMRETLLGKSRGSVPSVGSEQPARPVWNSGQAAAAAQGQQAQGQPMPAGGMTGGGGGSFLGTAAAAAAGVIGGSLLLGGIRSMMGGSQAFGASDALARGGGESSSKPWGATEGARGDLAREAGLDDIGSSTKRDTQPASNRNEDTADESGYDDSGDDDFGEDDLGGDDFGDDSI